MYTQARRFGLSQEAFYRFTIRGLFRELAAIKLARRDQFERDTVLAYQAVRIYVMSLTRKGGLRMPKLSKLLEEGHGELTPDEMRAQMRASADELARRGKVRRAKTQ
jgi:hypothetical protein